MPRTRRLLRNEEITYSAAKEQELNILHQLGYHEQQTHFFAHPNVRQDWMRAVVAHHLGLGSSSVCHVAEESNWLHGSFNVCIPITNDNRDDHRVLLRFPLPYRVGEAVMPGNGNEKIRCEAGTYAWLQENTDVPIPSLFGFSLSTGETFTRVENFSFLARYYQLLETAIMFNNGCTITRRHIWPTRSDAPEAAQSERVSGIQATKFKQLSLWPEDVERGKSQLCAIDWAW
ncbi:uncharacterized protein KD926_005872 [Aspergillus affinis]|uniref:uncharacterized protein n=1 Tax=Aspergillus affinis TaxID=1070780 RepID=UPI0022FEBA43|nr:uncharacterized protein KD926_005872 [Aspergillus affinis]KAI9045929.1 hypothetical protein KD926_005872 [Aspergillus affinis]